MEQNESHATYLFRPRAQKIFYALIIGAGIAFLGRNWDDQLLFPIALLYLAIFLHLLVRYFFPRQILLGSSKLQLPHFLPGRWHIFEWDDILSFRIKTIQGNKMLYLNLKNRKIHFVNADDIVEWERFKKELSSRVSESP